MMFFKRNKVKNADAAAAAARSSRIEAFKSMLYARKISEYHIEVEEYLQAEAVKVKALEAEQDSAPPAAPPLTSDTLKWYSKTSTTPGPLTAEQSLAESGVTITSEDIRKANQRIIDKAMLAEAKAKVEGASSD